MRSILSQFWRWKFVLASLFIVLVYGGEAIIWGVPRANAASSGPLSPGTVVDDATVGTLTWLTPGNATANDGLITSATGRNTTTHYLKATNFGFSIPAGATINGIQVEFLQWKSNGTPNVTDSSIKIVKGGTISGNNNSAGATWVLGSPGSYASFGGPSDLWGLTWTASDINDSGFGVVLSAAIANFISDNVAVVNHVRITVYYTPSETPARIIRLRGGVRLVGGVRLGGMSKVVKCGPGSNVTFTNIGNGQCRTVITAAIATSKGNSFDVPTNWNDSNNTIEVWGGGGGGASNNFDFPIRNAGGGGAYSASTAEDLTPLAQLGVRVGTGGLGETGGSIATDGGDTYFDGSGTTCAAQRVCAKGGTKSTAAADVGDGGAAASGLGDTKKSGGNGGTTPSSGSGGGGGGAGNSGADGSAGSNGLSGDPRDGGHGGDSIGGGGAGGTVGTPNGASATPNQGGGGGGGGGSSYLGGGGNGALPGGGGGAGGTGDTPYQFGGNGGDGQIVITYTP